ncbi:DUF4893 domain-containing protein [Loktanella sp. SALINAS62]|uniref:DUF4893 domain-containing protein n=1 Tax=Loktanella sp. SALINAS62 TaxID=2706124 RepID=UPI001B8B540E|nr:DUF4893 domain-containing protein [Loktanella sp. SALINAS62]MBS1303193.1 DUF4893 domain-containing protein [Loktanella sp. SALINAS62]
MLRLAVLLCLFAGTAAQAQTTLRPADQVRLDALTTSAGTALLAALARGSRGDIDLLQEVMEGTPLAPIETTLSGDWSCRTIKLGGATALTVYAPFDCVITPSDDGGFDIEKTTGTQQMIGQISLRPEGMVLTATGYVADAEPVSYAELPDDYVTDGTVWPMVGVVAQTAPDRARILMPLPALESSFDVLSLTR